jgi:hypothetical protein
MRRTIGTAFLLCTWLCGTLQAKGVHPLYCHRPGQHHHQSASDASAAEPSTNPAQPDKGTKNKRELAKRSPSVPVGASNAPDRKDPSNLKPGAPFHVAK